MGEPASLFVPRPFPKRTWTHAAGFAIAAVLSTLISIAPISWDNSWYLHTAVSLLQDGNLDLSEYRFIIAQRNDYGVQMVNGQLLNYFPIGQTLLALPWAAPMHFAGADVYTIHMASIYIANGALAYFLFLVMTAFRGEVRTGWLLAGIAWFCSPNLAHLTGDYWSHGGAQILLCLMLLAAFAGMPDRFRRYRWGAIGVLTALLYLTRPNALLLAAPFAWFAWRRGWDAFVVCGFAFLCAMAAAMGFFMIQLGEVLPPYYGASRLSLQRYPEGLSGQWISPNRGLLIFCPFVLFSLLGIVRALKTRDALLTPLALSIIAFALAVAAFPLWWGGRSYGPRLLTELTPYLVLMLTPVLPDIRGDRLWLRVFALTVAISLLIQFRGIYSNEPHEWNRTIPDEEYFWLFDEWMVLKEDIK